MTSAKRKTKSKEAVTAKTSDKKHLAIVAQAQPSAPESEVLPSPLGKAPLYKERLGRVHLAIWAREDKSGTVRFSLKLSRSYKTETGFRDTSSLDQSDLDSAITLLTQAQATLPPLKVAEPQS